MPNVNKQNISGIKFPGNDTVFVLQAETTDNFTEENNLVATNVKGVNEAIKKIKTEIDNNNNSQNQKIKDLESKISGAMHFVGVEPSVPEEVLKYKPGDVILVGNKEYVFDKNQHFIELGDTTQEAKDISNLKKSIETIQGESSVPGSIQKALADSKKYTDELSEGQVTINKNAIVNINDPSKGILKTSKDYTDTKITNLNVAKITIPSGSLDSPGSIISAIEQKAGKISIDSRKLTEEDIPKLKPEKSGINNSIIIKENISILAENFIQEEDNQTDYPFKADISIPGCTNKYYPSVSLKLEDAISGIFAPTAISHENGVYIYASEQPIEMISGITVALYKAF